MGAEFIDLSAGVNRLIQKTYLFLKAPYFFIFSAPLLPKTPNKANKLLIF